MRHLPLYRFFIAWMQCKHFLKSRQQFPKEQQMRININENFKKLSENYLFSEISARVERFRAERGDLEVISLGIGDVSLPLSPTVAREMARACTELGTARGFHGYGDTQGEVALREAIARYYTLKGVRLDLAEIFISDGAKSDLGNLNDLLGDNETLIFDPVYPVYLDASIISGRRVRFLPLGNGKTLGFPPEDLPNLPFVIYLCSPNNPTGAVFTREELQEWVNFARKSGSLIIFDAAYESYVTEVGIPRSIFEMDGARECAIEVCSFSKMAGFTGVRCGFSVIPFENPLHKMWKRRQATKFNGASYISQRGALAALSPQGLGECRKNIAYYMENAHALAHFSEQMGIPFCGGINAPYLWLKCPFGIGSWELFELLLDHAGVVCTPGAGFGEGGDKHIRLSAFASREDTLKAIGRMRRVFDKL